jgi:hypothetical protein
MASAIGHIMRKMGNGEEAVLDMRGNHMDVILAGIPAMPGILPDQGSSPSDPSD